MVANTEPIFLAQPLLVTKRVQVGIIFPPNPALGLTGSGETLVDCDAESSGAIITDLWAQPAGAIAGGVVLRFFLSDYDNNTINLLFETSVSAAAASPFPRQELGALLPEVLSPTQTGLAGKKKALYIRANQRLTVGLSADLTGPLVVGLQGGLY